jgi:hypothetical protein
MGETIEEHSGCRHLIGSLTHDVNRIHLGVILRAGSASESI